MKKDIQIKKIPVKAFIETCGYLEYNTIIKSLGAEIIIEVTDDDYQGDIRLLIKLGSNYGFVIIGYGSCSGCDALQACETDEDYEELRDSIENDIKWFPSPEECLKFFEEHDWKGNWYGHDYETTNFRNQCEKYLKEIIIKNLG